MPFGPSPVVGMRMYPSHQRLRIAGPDPADAVRPPRLVRLDQEWPPASIRRDHGLRGLTPDLVDMAYPRLEWEPPGEDDDPTSPPLAASIWEFIQLDTADFD
jgi:hypothetical protein